MVKLVDNDIIDRHKGETAVVCAHGPTFKEHLGPILRLQQAKKVIRFSPNNWFSMMNREWDPDYWVLSSNVDTVLNYCDYINDTSSSILFADSVDLTPYDWIEENIENDYYGYDQRHFKNDKCLDILKNFKDHYTENKNFDFDRYGNNTIMWQPPFEGTPGGVDVKGRCCHRIVEGRKTIQEMLQENTGYQEQYSSGSTVALHMLAFTVLMGFEKVYVAGLDLDYGLGYANENMEAPEDFWKNSNETKNLLNDLHVINESAKKKGTQIINLNPGVWYGIFEQTDSIPITLTHRERLLGNRETI